MNRRIDFTHLGGLQTYQDTLEYLQYAYSQPMDAVAQVIGDKVVLSGVADQGATVSDGWISYGGEILPFSGGLKSQYVIIEQIVGTEEFADTVQRPVYYTRRLKFGNALGPDGGFLFSDLSRLPFSASSIKEALANAQRVTKSIINFEPSVIIEGCAVDTGTPGIVKISAGAILFNGKLTITPAYQGGFPAYVSEAGLWSTAQPSAGLYVLFDPHTSQRYRDVLRRFQYQTGDMLMSKVLSDRFDPNTGIGRWEWKGFKLSTDMRGRAPVGYWFGNDGANNLYESAYRVIGYQFGESRHTLTKNELPNYEMESEMIGDNGYPDGSGDRSSGGNQYLLSPDAANKHQRRLMINSGGNDVGHENRQPSRIVAIIERDENL